MNDHPVWILLREIWAQTWWVALFLLTWAACLKGLVYYGGGLP